MEGSGILAVDLDTIELLSYRAERKALNFAKGLKRSREIPALHPLPCRCEVFYPSRRYALITQVQNRFLVELPASVSQAKDILGISPLRLSRKLLRRRSR